MQVRCKCLGGWCKQFFHIRPYVWTVGRRLFHVCVGREITSVYERLRIVCAAIHTDCVMGCGGGLLSADGPVQLFTGLYESRTSSGMVGRL